MNTEEIKAISMALGGILKDETLQIKSETAAKIAQVRHDLEAAKGLFEQSARNDVLELENKIHRLCS